MIFKFTDKVSKDVQKALIFQMEVTEFIFLIKFKMTLISSPISNKHIRKHQIPTLLH